MLACRVSALRPSILFVVACAALACTVLFVKLVPSGDGPQHLLAARAVADHADVALDYARWVEPQFPLTGGAYCELLIALLGLLPWREAYATSFILVLWLWTGSVALLGRALGKPAWGVVVGVVTAYSWFFYMGMLAYVIATSFGLLGIALALSTSRWAPRTIALLALLLLASAHAHIFAAVLAGLLILAIAAGGPDRRRAVASVVVAGLPAVVLAAFVALQGGRIAGTWVHSGALERMSVVAWGFVGGPWWRAWPPVVVGALGIGMALRAGGRARLLALLSLSLIVTAWLLPRDAPGWQLVAPRPLLLGMTLSMLLFEPARIVPRVARVAIGAVVVVATVGWSVAFHGRFEQASADVLAQLHAPLTAPPGHRLPVSFAPAAMPPGDDIRFLNPFFNLGQLFAVTQGGWTAFTFSNLPIDVVRARAGLAPDPDRAALVTRMWLYDDAERRAAFTDLMSSARRYDGVIAFEDPADHAGWIARGFAPTLVEGRLQLLRFQGCRASVELPPGVVVVENGFTPHSARGATRRQRVTAGADRVDVGNLKYNPI